MWTFTELPVVQNFCDVSCQKLQRCVNEFVKVAYKSSWPLFPDTMYTIRKTNVTNFYVTEIIEIDLAV